MQVEKPPASSSNKAQAARVSAHMQASQQWKARELIQESVGRWLCGDALPGNDILAFVLSCLLGMEHLSTLCGHQ